MSTYEIKSQLRDALIAELTAMDKQTRDAELAALTEKRKTDGLNLTELARWSALRAVWPVIHSIDCPTGQSGKTR